MKRRWIYDADHKLCGSDKQSRYHQNLFSRYLPCMAAPFIYFIPSVAAPTGEVVAMLLVIHRKIPETIPYLLAHPHRGNLDRRCCSSKTGGC
jgi:hypothetical protein